MSHLDPARSVIGGLADAPLGPLTPPADFDTLTRSRTQETSMRLVLTSGAARIELHISGLDGEPPHPVIDGTGGASATPGRARSSGSMFRRGPLLVLASVAVFGFVDFRLVLGGQTAGSQPSAPLVGPAASRADEAQAPPSLVRQRLLRELQTPPVVVPPASAVAPADGKGGNPFGLE